MPFKQLPPLAESLALSRYFDAIAFFQKLEVRSRSTTFDDRHSRSSGVNPVNLAILANIFGPISSPS